MTTFYKPLERDAKGKIVLHGIIRKMPDTATPMLLQPVEREIQVGTAKVQLNAMTGSYFISGQKGETTPYIEAGLGMAVRLALTVDHWNRTGERKKFEVSEYTLDWKKKK